ncbi:transposase [Chitinophaga oryziterrae]|uniref:Transposase n=1 Tax=Chitinophaga oryziterrae TaxID=1031224 RepID=A0A6N8J890_9BACT|nr:transposase [Chitinophaga oryziterrae]MVT41323.1 transposase [Chitinophaga oryziterrae]
MTKKNRRKFSGDFKAKVVLEALKERSTMEELARKYELHPTQINTWKREAAGNWPAHLRQIAGGLIQNNRKTNWKSCMRKSVN